MSVQFAWRKRSELVLGGIFLVLLMLAEGSLAAAQTASSSVSTDQQTKLDMSLMAQLDIDPILMKFIGAVVTKIQGLETDNVALRSRTQALEVENKAFQKRTHIVEVQLDQVTKDKTVLENMTQMIELENTVLKKRVTSLESIVLQLENKTTTESRLLTAEVENVSVRLDYCEEEASFVREMERRRMQDADVCDESGLSEMFAACCPTSGSSGHRRSLQDQGCDVLPSTCPVACAPLFIDFFEGCEDMTSDLTPTAQQAFAGLYADCTEVAQQAAAISDAAMPALMFHVVVIDQEAEQQATMFDRGSGLGSSPPLGPVVLRPDSSPTPSHSGSSGVAEAVRQFQRICSKANLTICAPACNSLSEGYMLNLMIAARGTIMTCLQEGGVFSWQGQAALGSTITNRFQTWIENILAHAAGTFSLQLLQATPIVVASVVDLVAGQSALVRGPPKGALPVWTHTGSGPAFVIGASASLDISRLTVSGGSSTAPMSVMPLLTVQAGGRLSVADSLLMPAGDLQHSWSRAVPLPCAGAADGMCGGPHAKAAIVEGPSSVSLAAPLVCGFWSEDCVALPAGVTAQQRAAGLAAGIPWNADKVCFLHQEDHLVVPDDPNFGISAGQGAFANRGQNGTDRGFANFDPSMPPIFRCDNPEGTIVQPAYGDPVHGIPVPRGHGPFGLNQSGSRWYRFPNGRTLPTTPPGFNRCGTYFTGWLSGWAPEKAGGAGPPWWYTGAPNGTFPPPVGSPPAAGTVCFDHSGPIENGLGAPCGLHVRIRAVSCGEFALWELPTAPNVGDCNGYCLAPDRCAACAATGRCIAESWAGPPPGTTCLNNESTTFEIYGGPYGTCSDVYDLDPDRCVNSTAWDDSQFTAATMCCACGGGIADFVPGHCLCTAGWTGEFCDTPLALAGLPAGVSLAQYERGIAIGVHPTADNVCFTEAFVTVPDDPNLLTTAGQGEIRVESFDANMPSINRCDANTPTVHLNPCRDAGRDCCVPPGGLEKAACADGFELTHQPSSVTQWFGGCPNFDCIRSNPAAAVNSTIHGPFGLQHGGTHWYRLPAGKGLATAPPGGYHCGTTATGWLSGWDGGVVPVPDEHYATPANTRALPPPIGAPPAAGTVCFHVGGPSSVTDTNSTTCMYPTTVHVVSCGAFVLYELPPAPACNLGYCMAAIL